MDDLRKHELRCVACVKAPLLAFYGVDEKGKLFVHQKIFKSGRIFGETVYYGGEVSLRCRECFQWNKVVFRAQDAELEAARQPQALNPNPSAASSLRRSDPDL